MSYGLQLRQRQSSPLSSSVISMFRRSEHQQLPLHFGVATTTAKKRFVIYNCAVSSVMTGNSWTVSYRYSEFAAFSENVQDQWTCQDAKCSGSCEAIREFLWECFPRKRLSRHSKSTHAIADRKIKFETVMQYLLRCVLLPGSAMKCLHVRQYLPMNLFKFLGVSSDVDKRSLLQVFVDNCQTATCTGQECRDSFPSDAPMVNPIEPSRCTICLDEVELVKANEDCKASYGPSSSIVLPCQHVFHRLCIFEWLLFQFHCPVCRARIGPQAVKSYCKEKNHIFQWWLSDFEENPLSITQRQIVSDLK